MIKRSIVIIIILLIQLNSLLFCNSQNKYNSICVSPTFSPNEVKIVFWDVYNCEDVGFFKNVVLKIYDTKKNRIYEILGRKFYKPKNISWLEQFEEFINAKWSPNGNHIALSLNGSDIEIMEFKSMRIVSKICFRKNDNDLFFGYFYIKWIDNFTLVVGYMSNYTNLPNTNDTYGLIKKKEDKFIVEKNVLDNDSELIPNRSFYFGNKNYFNENNECYPILQLDKFNRVENLFFKKENISVESEIFDLPKRNSNERVILAISKSGKIAIIGGVIHNEIKDTKFKIKTEIINIPKQFRDSIIECFNSR